jgi:hypothetical protein
MAAKILQRSLRYDIPRFSVLLHPIQKMDMSSTLIGCASCLISGLTQLCQHHALPAASV